MDANQKGGDAGSKGVGFQIGLLTLFLLNALQKFTSWRLSTEKVIAGKFDDVVLEWPAGAILLQAKHKKSKKITKEDLLPTTTKSDDFSLPKYFLSYQEINHEFKGNNTLIICSNAEVHESALEFLTSQKMSPQSILYCANDDYSFYTLNTTILPHLKERIEAYLAKGNRNKNKNQTAVTDENLNDFVQRLQIFARFPADKHLENIIEQSLTSLKRSNTLYEHIFGLELRSKVMDWFQHKDGVYITEANAKAIFSELRTEKYWQTLEQYEVELRYNDLEFPDSKRIYHMAVDNGYLLQVIKIHHKFKNSKTKILSINSGDSIEVQRQIVDTFQLKKYTFLVIIWTKSTEESVKTEITDKLRGIMTTQQNKKIILVIESGGELNRLFGLTEADLDVGFGSGTFSELADKTQGKILNKRNIVFQGRNVNLRELILTRGSQDLEKAADLSLQKLIEDDKVTVGASLSNLDESVARLYINRRFKRKTERRDSAEMNFYSEEDIFDVTKKIILIADTAGMGKTTVVTNLANVIKKKYPLLWVVKLELNEFSLIFKDFSKNKAKPISVLNLLNSRNTTKLRNELSTFIFALERQVVLILDGVNEVSPDYTDLVVSLLLECQEASNFAKVFVTTRPHVVLELQEKLQVALFTLEPFTDENQVSFLTNYWTNCLNLREDIHRRKCGKYAKALVRNISLTDLDNDMECFAAIPLQLRMLADTFQDSMLSNDTSDWEGCKEYIYSDEEEPRLPEKMNLVQLYDMFIDKKREIFIDRENPSGHTAVTQALRNQFEECLYFHREVALNKVLPEKERNLFSFYGKDRDMEAATLKIGVVQKSNNEFNFIHKTLAEYYVADSIIEELKLSNHNVAFQKFLIEEVFYAVRFNVVLTFLDNFLQNNLESIPIDAFQTYKSITSCDQGSTFKYKNNLIHQLAEKGCVAVLHLLLNCVKFTVVKDKKGRLYEFDANYKKRNRNALTCFKYLLKNFGLNIEDDFGRTPLHFAASRGHLKMVKFLVLRGANIDTKHWGNTPLVEAAHNGQIETTKYLLKRALGIETAGIVEAVRINELDMETFLLEIIQGNDEFNVKDMKVPYVAACMGYLGVLKASIERGTKVDSKFENGESLIIAAACGKHRDIVEYLVQNGVDINSENNKGRTALHLIAQESRSVPIAKLLIQLGIDIHITDSVGKTALHLAASSNHFDMMKLLIENGANANAKDKVGSTALHEAAACGNLECIKFLTTNGADVNVTDSKGNTALLLCVGQWKASDIAKFLINSGADVNIRNYREQTALHVAVCRDDENATQFLAKLAEKADEDGDVKYEEWDVGRSSNLQILVEDSGIINGIDENGRTALHLAVEKGRLPLVRILIEAGAKVNLKDKGGQTPLHVAADKGQEEVVQLLIKHGADIGSVDNMERTPADLAMKAGHLHLLQYLRRKVVKSAGVRIFSAVRRLFRS